MWDGKRCIMLLMGSVLAICSTGQCQTANPPNAELLTKENLVDTARPDTGWFPASVGQRLLIGDRLRTGALSRATMRLTDLSVLRINELTTLRILEPEKAAKPGLDLRSGAVYFFSREKPQEMRIRTPIATGALRGTEFHLSVGAGGRTVLTMFDGEVELRNALGGIVVRSGEQGNVEAGRAPYKTAVIEAENIIQWCLYYPGVIDPAELGLSDAEQESLAVSLEAYRQGDLLHALQAYPGGRVARSDAERVYRATLLLEVGQVDKANAQLARLPRNAAKAETLRQLIAAVKFREFARQTPPSSASDWMAESYYQQSRSQLEAALQAAQRATELAPEFGFAWTRLAELEFSFGRTLRAAKILERGLELAPRNAQAHALQGYLLSAQNRIGAARRSFNDAIALDGALGNAWLGRGLTFIRQGHGQEGRDDLQTAAVLEPNRSLFRSYLGKAFSQVGDNPKASLELGRATQLDPRDPTPWLYSAIQKKQENRYNAAIDDLEKSIALNDNRRVYRSGFLLDQDRAVRGTNLAVIYQNNGMTEQSVREAVRAVDSDYASAAAHLFLANSYNALRDPRRVLLRYETAAFNELLLSHLLSPVGGGPLSQFVSEQEYSKLFEKDGLGVSSITEYYGFGEIFQTASQYGTFGNISYALDAEYLYNDGLRPNNRFSHVGAFATFKLQLGPQDTLFFQAIGSDTETGEVLQHYDEREVETERVNGRTIPNRASLTFDLEEKQEPGLLLLGWHREWSPGHHTLLLLGRLAAEQIVTAEDTRQIVVTRDVAEFAPANIGDTADGRPRFSLLRDLPGKGEILEIGTSEFDIDYGSQFSAFTVDLQQVATFGPQTILIGGRYQQGQFETRARLDDFANGSRPTEAALFRDPPADQNDEVTLERYNAYLYSISRLTSWLSLTAGIAVDALTYPDNFRSPPINDREQMLEKISPKGGLILHPWRGATLRGGYAEAISGTSFDESVRLEPTQVAGFIQAYRSLISESLVGSVAGNELKIAGLSFEQKLSTRTYLGLEYAERRQELTRTIGVFDRLLVNSLGIANLPSSLKENDKYEEKVFTATINQLLGDDCALAASYNFVESDLRQHIPEAAAAARRSQNGDVIEPLALFGNRRMEAGLHEVRLHALYNHRSGAFARAEANYFHQENDQFAARSTGSRADGQRPIVRVENVGAPGEDFWQFNLLTGYRFHRNQCEVSIGVLNLTGADYRLNPLNPYRELPRETTFFARCKLNF